MRRPPPLARIPREVACLTDYEPLARERLDDNAWAYLAGTAADGVTHAANRAAFDALTLNSRVLREMSGGSTETEFLGMKLRHPVMVAPVAYQKLYHPDGERATAMAAGALDAPMIVSTQTSTPIEEVAVAAEGSPLMFQLYWQADRGATRALIERVEAAGVRAIVPTADAPISGIRNAEQRAGFHLPAGIAPVMLGQWPPAQKPLSGHPIFDGLLGHAPTWRDIEWLLGTTKLPVILKGVLSPDDARRAADIGCASVVVSNHGGRTIDSLPPSITALPRVVDAVGDRMPVLLDSGIRRGTDILKALALGARAVLVGRPLMYALAAAGPLGVGHAIKVLVEELAVAVALTGHARITDIGPEAIFR
ncbi:alpha-hydroxy acid oxidase [Terrarubrum flagellatum]|uniref:alpha-hydroxy acid oxidase n=1 Tax=Terrirubrum flagellatum TaxID=2895980 RepID=UPI0031450939